MLKGLLKRILPMPATSAHQLHKHLLARINSLEDKITQESDIAHLTTECMLGQKEPYKIKVNQPDLSGYEQNFFSAPQIVHGYTDAVYIPTYHFAGNFINKNHQYYTTCKMQGVCIDIGIEGWLTPEEALKIYELAYFCKENILQLGTYKGLSASVIIQAIRDGGGIRTLDTVEINHGLSENAKTTLNNVFENLTEANFHVNDGTLFMDPLIVQNKKYGFIFIDHWHGYKAVQTSAIRLHRLLSPGGFVLFHDYLDVKNFNAEDSSYGVYQAVNDVLLTDTRFLYCGAFGSSALFRFVP